MPRRTLTLAPFALALVIATRLSFAQDASTHPSPPEAPTQHSHTDDASSDDPPESPDPHPSNGHSAGPPVGRHEPSFHMFSRGDDAAEHERWRASQPRGRRPRRRDPNEPFQLELPGMPDAWYFPPTVGGRQRVFVYMHPRGGDPKEGCQHFRQTVARFGWLLCPVGPGDRGQGRHIWNNNATLARRYTLAALDALHRLFPRRVRMVDNVIMGFSEGAFTAMQTGIAEPRVFPRWVIFAAHDGYIDMNSELFPVARRFLHREYLITGAHDEIVEHTRRAATFMTRNHLGHVQMVILPRAQHELPPDFAPVVRRALLWVTH